MLPCRPIALSLFLVSRAAVNAGEPVTIGETRRLHSAVLDEDREYQVHLPAGYRWSPESRYPVLYVLDGTAHFLHTVGAVDFLAAQGEIPETIVVAITSTVRARDFTQTDWPKAWIGGGGADKFKRFLSAELVPAVEREYRTSGVRVLSGHSAGGQFALHCLASEPALFRAIFAFSPSLDWDDRLPAKELKKALDAVASLNAFLYVSRGDDSGQALADYESLVAALGARKVPGFRWKSEAFSGERQASTPLLGQIHALRALYAGYRMPEDVARKGLAAAETYYEGVSRTLGWQIPVPEEAINALGNQALMKGNVDEAITLFRRNVDAGPGSVNAWESLADGCARAGLWPDAVKASERAADLAAKAGHPDAERFRQRARKMNDRWKQAADPPR